mmetsp:Transcript_3628/g.7353  ORF Transcript_3628/g.7353 Transcript_3628/m.7353 type:complete len:201 (+) Transcript_3628:468-1070(+)
MALSAVSSARMARTEAKVSGREVPRATTVNAVTVSRRPTRHPNTEARSPIMAVTSPMRPRATMKHAHPPQIFGGGTTAARIFHPIDIQCITQSATEASLRSPPAFTLMACRNCSPQVGMSSCMSPPPAFGLYTTFTSAVCSSCPSITSPFSSTCTTSTRNRTDLSSGFSLKGSSKAQRRTLICFENSYGFHCRIILSTGW